MTDTLRCDKCDAYGSLLRVNFLDRRWVLGFPVGQYRTVGTRLCQAHGLDLVRSCFWKTLVWGWWHPLLLLSKPVLLIRLFALRQQLKRPHVPIARPRGW
jgi:hypothetical protein